ncbi:MAG: hypothetical protein V4574_05085 [Pseudomonadota bacterium]
MTSLDYEYYSRRARQERESADRCLDHSARHAHLELAARYAAMLRDIPMSQQPQSQAQG